MTPMEAIVAATRVNARILGLADDLGTVEPGKIADIVVLRGDPRFSITELNEPELVVKDGKVYRRDQPPVRRQP